MKNIVLVGALVFLAGGCGGVSDGQADANEPLPSETDSTNPSADAEPAETHAMCSTNSYGVIWSVAGVYNRPSHGAYHIMNKRAGDIVTGPTGWGHVANEGNYWTKVWIYSDPSFREGWIRDDAVNYRGCN
ncbi:hypothetical protein [Pyxidicoccus xibeiensis]|uniref:hypothetical protein n=1 Tax=Pyxidicoccus xibeiensis TaxID=2906759 RepID=UPI0020A78C9C|nr:hypothetical protein [Pyxidicoccus xibeiensis]MCP3140921.1 hypothetical protein [Pyxidicoccus xibeiensis]